MKIAIIGSRTLCISNLQDYLPSDISEIVSGGAKGIDICARNYAIEHHIKLTEFLPDYSKYGRSAPLIRNIQIVEYADEVIAFWDGHSNGTVFTLKEAKKRNKKVRIFKLMQ